MAVTGRNQGGAQNVQNNMEQWEHSFKFEIPEIHGSQVADKLLNWITTVDDFLEFKHVPLERCVLVLAMRFLNRAVAWWSQLKASKLRLENFKIDLWDKLKKHIMKTFIPYNYDALRLQNL